ncbi:MAG: hypothetical protein ACREAU_01860 [Nitrosopumilaceae archaeon]
MKIDEILDPEQTQRHFGPQSYVAALGELKPILVLLQTARSAIMRNQPNVAQTEIQRALAKYQNILPALQAGLDRLSHL